MCKIGRRGLLIRLEFTWSRDAAVDRPVLRRAIGMRGLSRFLLGSALGAALGIVIAQRRRRKREKASPRAYWEAAGVGAGASQTDQAVTVVDEPEPVVVIQPEPIFEPESVMEPQAEDITEPEPEPEPEPDIELVPVVGAEPELEAEPEPVVEFVPLIEPEPKPEPELSPERGIIGLAAMFEPTLPDLGPAFDVVSTPELLDEPLPGAGWESSLAPLAEEDVEELFPIPAEEEIVDFDRVPEIEAPPLNGDAAAASGTPSISADDLKARIEETRRRIRRELDEPFLGEGDTTPAPEPAVQELSDQPDDANAAVPAVEPEVGSPEEMAASSDEALAPVAEVKEPAKSGPPPDMELGVDFNAMKARIEQTRGRLKAKAFDAMMTGESALLGREAPGKAAERPGPAILDHDLDQTIETTLREEED
jgi:hypothetical protein